MIHGKSFKSLKYLNFLGFQFVHSFLNLNVESDSKHKTISLSLRQVRLLQNWLSFPGYSKGTINEIQLSFDYLKRGGFNLYHPRQWIFSKVDLTFILCVVILFFSSSPNRVGKLLTKVWRSNKDVFLNKSMCTK